MKPTIKALIEDNQKLYQENRRLSFQVMVGDYPSEYELAEGMTWKELAELRLQKLRDLGHDPMCRIPVQQELKEANDTISLLAQQLSDNREIIRRLTT